MVARMARLLGAASCLLLVAGVAIWLVPRTDAEARQRRPDRALGV